MARSRAVHHAHASRTSGTGLLAGRARRWAGRSIAHAVDGASDADTTRCLCGSACGCSDGDKIALAGIQAALDAIARGQEGVEALDEAGMATEEGGNPLDDARGIYGLALELKRRRRKESRAISARWTRMRAVSEMSLATYVFHDIEETIVDIGMLCELDLDLVQVGERILDVEGRL
jgi:hypothetical protein